jgi:signal peptidase
VRRAANLVALLLVLGLAVLIGNVATGGALSYQQFVVRTGSMEPTIPPKSLVIVKTGEYHLGQVVTFHKGDQVVSHRLVRRNPDGTFTTKGDANPTPDAVPLEPRRIVGGVVDHISGIGFWVFWVSRPTTLASVALFIFFVWLMWPILYGRDENEDDRAAPRVA